LPDPIQFILQDHDRQVENCSRLEQLVSASETEPTSEWAASLLSFLSNDLPLHVDDEELDLFPRLSSRRPPDSNLADILDQLVTEHETDKGLADLVIKGLRAIAEGEPPEHPFRFQMNVRAFCEMQRRHLNWENRVVVPLAQTLLTEEDKQDLAQRMVARRSGSEPR
jgi:hemerythrin-like domain-containing protein